MTVYVDSMKTPYRRMVMSHMLADDIDQLHAMAQSLGLKRKWFQSHSTPHYDLCQSKRSLAIQAGAKVIDRKQTVEIIRKWREALALGKTSII